MSQKYVVLLKTNFCTMFRNNQKYFVVTAVKYSSFHNDYTYTHTHIRTLTLPTYIILNLHKFDFM